MAGPADDWLKLGATVSVAAPLYFALLWLFDRAGFGALARMGWQVLVPGSVAGRLSHIAKIWNER